MSASAEAVKRTRVWSNINFMNQTSLLKQETDEYVAAPRRFWVNFRAKIDVDISKHVRAFAGVAGNVRNDRLAGSDYTNSGIYETIFQLPPTMIGPTTEDGRVTTMESVSLPTYGILNRSVTPSIRVCTLRRMPALRSIWIS